MKHLRKSPIVKTLFSGFAMTTLAMSTILVPGLDQTAEASLEDSPKAVIDEVWQIVNNEFVDREFNHADWLALRQDVLSRQYSSQAEAYRTIQGMLRQLGDPYTRFLDPQDFEKLTDQTSGELSGIGIRLAIDPQSQNLVIVEPIPNSPAAEAGIQAGDRLLAIDGKLTSLMSLEQASEAIKGEVGTDVMLEVGRDQDVLTLSLTRTQIELPTVHATLRQEGQKRIGYIKLDEFSSHAAEQMEKAIEDLSQKRAEAFVLDLRGNPGGLLFASVDIARMWMESGAIVRTIDRKGGDRAFSANNTAITNLPLVVLVDGYSASASEILAGALKDNKRATIVGTRTYGKGTVQSVHSLSDGSGLAVTISRYFLPSGVNISNNGITPDVELNLSREQMNSLNSNPTLVGTQADPAYSRAIAIINTPKFGQATPPDPISIRQ
jgi:carboxyl-terminal processing protease